MAALDSCKNSSSNNNNYNKNKQGRKRPVQSGAPNSAKFKGGCRGSQD